MDVCQEAILHSLSTLIFFTPAVLIIIFTVLPNVNFVISLLFMYLVAIQMFFTDMILKYSFGFFLSIVVKLLYYGIQFFMLLSQTSGLHLTATKVYT